MDAEVVLRPIRDRRWSSFVANHPSALSFHDPSWAEMLAECYGFQAYCLSVEDAASRIIAGLPVIEVPRPSMRPRWVSLPFTDRCPPLLADGADAADPELAQRLDEARRAFRVGRLELRGEVPRAQPAGTFLTHHVPLDRSAEDVYASFHANQVRRNIRRAEKAGVTVRQGTGESDLTEVFYRLHTRTRQRLGLAVQPRRYFQLLWRHMLEPGHGTVMIAELGGTPVAAMVLLASSAACIYKYGASDERHWPARPNHLLFWTAIQWAMAQGCPTFDFGRTDVGHDGLRDFKSRWGSVEGRLTYSVLEDRVQAPVPSRRRGRGAVPPAVRSWVIRHGPDIIPRALGELQYRNYA